MGKIADIFEGDYPINWDLAREELDLIIFRATIGLKEDKRYIKYAKDSKVPYGVYHYVTATTAEDSREQARFFVEHANKAYKKPLFYIADIEGDRFNSTNTEPVCIAFLDELRKLGCKKIGMYINRKYKYAGKAIEMCDIMWIPHWGKDDGNIPPDSSKPKYYNDLWQYTSNGTLLGLDEDVDLNLLNGDKSLEWFLEGWESDKEEKSMYDKFSNMHFVEFVKKFVGMPYWYGTCIYPCTESKLTAKTKQYPEHYTSDRTARYKADIAAHKICADCVGLMKGYAWTNAGENVIESIGKEKPTFTCKYKTNNMPDKSASGLFSYAKSQGLDWGGIDTLPEIPGLGLYMAGHVGVYIGNGEAIEERGFNYGCVKTKLKDRKWLNWFKIPSIIYPEAEAPAAEVLGTVTLRKNSRGNDVKELQANLNILLVDDLEVDGIFGAKTEAAIKQFQSENGLKVDGIYGEKTHAALMAALSDYTKEEEKQEEEVIIPEPNPKPTVIYTTKNSVNVRLGDSTSYEKITNLSKDTVLNIVCDKDGQPIVSSNGWYAIYIMDKIGWLSGNYVTKNI